MDAKSIQLSPQMSVVATLAALLERVDQSGVAPDAAQYQKLIQRLDSELAVVDGDPTLPAVLDAFPILAQIYENQHYEQAGLCRAELDAATAAELEARQLLLRAAAKGHPA